MSRRNYQVVTRRIEAAGELRTLSVVKRWKRK